MSFDLDAITRDNVKGLSPYSSARDEYVSDGSKMVFLDANENPYDNGVNRYPDPKQRNLKGLLAQRKGITEANLLLGNGSDEVLDLLFRAFCEPGMDNIITLPPTYGMYKVLSGINGVENREVLLDADFQPKLSEILATADGHSKMLFLCSPNNPTGNTISAQGIAHLLEHFKGLVVMDEAYIDFSSQASWVGQWSQYPNLVVTQTLSKAYGMAGIRLGICMASVAIISVLNKIKPPYNVNELTQQRALERVLDQQAVQREITAILAERQRLYNVLQEVPFVSKVHPTEANFILAQVDNATLRYDQLLKKGIVVRNRTAQPLCHNTLRFTVGTPEENQTLIAALNQLS
ncbi:histidinol-phosphate transaminase [Maribacter sp. 2307ULW6-5]|uniref:histidinol-phosphate transaminase n=1 Tax=Maribacter sp. 2307ULW6-5 TaxID=3386275 RepID=UPI0039BD24E8